MNFLFLIAGVIWIAWAFYIESCGVFEVIFNKVCPFCVGLVLVVSSLVHYLT